MILAIIFVLVVFPALISWADYLKKVPAYQFVVDGRFGSPSPTAGFEGLD